MGCRLILNLCRVYYHPTTVQPQSIWAASEGIRFKPPALATEATTEGHLTVERGQSPESAYESYGLAPLGRIKVEDVEEQ